MPLDLAQPIQRRRDRGQFGVATDEAWALAAGNPGSAAAGRTVGESVAVKVDPEP